MSELHSGRATLSMANDGDWVGNWCINRLTTDAGGSFPFCHPPPLTATLAWPKAGLALLFVSRNGKINNKKNINKVNKKMQPLSVFIQHLCCIEMGSECAVLLYSSIWVHVHMYRSIDRRNR